MIATKKTCPKCQGSMTEGFLPDETDHGRKVTKWIEGPPDKRWYGLRFRGKATFYVQTFRCTRCGFLENYAPG